MDMLDGETEVRDYALERLIMLSDGVFAIAMTLLALDLRPEPGWDHTFAGLGRAIAIPFQTFFWAFFAAAIFWNTHRRQFGAYRRADSVIIVLNLLLLGEIIILPAATRLLAEMQYSVGALVMYLSMFALIGGTNAASWVYASFFTNIVKPPLFGPAEKIVVAFLHATVPVSMTALGVLSAMPGLHWLPVLMPAPLLILRVLRRLAVAIDRRRKPGIASHAVSQAAAGRLEGLDTSTR